MGKGKLEDYELSLEDSGGPILSVRTRGGDADIPQGDMSDAAFAALAKEAQDKGTLVEVKHADGSKTDGESFIQSFGKGRPIIGPDGTLVQTGDPQFGIPTAQNPFPGQTVADQGDQTGMPTTDLKFGIPTAQNPFPGQTVADQGDQTGMPTKELKPDAPDFDPDVVQVQGSVNPDELSPLPKVTPGAGKGEAGFVSPRLGRSDLGNAESQAALGLGLAGAGAKADAQAKYSEELAKNHDAAASAILASDALRKKTESDMVQRHQQFQSAMARLDQQIDDARNAKVNTGRFFSSMDAAQRVSAILAGACFGLAGQGMQWLQHVKSLVDQDIDAQKSDFERNLHGLQMKESSLKTAYAMAREAGLDGLAAVEAAKGSVLQKLGFDAMAIANNANTQIAKANGLMAQSAFFKEAAAHKMTAGTHNDSMIVHQANLDYQYAHLALEKEKMKAAAGAKLPLTDTELTRIAELKSSIQSLVRLTRSYYKARSGQMAGGGIIAAAIPGTDRHEYEKLARGDALAIGTNLLGKKGMDRLEEQDRFRTDYIPTTTELEREAEAKMSRMHEESINKYRNEFNGVAARSPAAALALTREGFDPDRVAGLLAGIRSAVPEGVTKGFSNAR